MITDFPEEINNKDVVNPATSKLFQVSTNSKQLVKQKSKIFHTFITKRASLLK